MTIKPDAYEQLTLELINRSRMDPGGEFARFIADAASQTATTANITSAIRFFNVDLTELASQFAALTATAPLAWSDQLSQSATTHSQLMIDNDLQSHNLPGEPSLGARVRAVGFEFQTLGENVFAFGEDAFYSHAAFFIDWGNTPTGIQTPAGHRNTIMDPAKKEIGIGVIAESNPATNVGPNVITQHIGTSFTTQPQLLGVVINDTDGDDFYDIGEGIANVTVTATGANGTFTTATWDSGGYQLALPAGTYTVTFSGNNINRTETVSINNENVKLDAETGVSSAVPSATSLAITNQMGLAFFGRGLDSTLSTSTGHALNSAQPTKNLLDLWFQYAINDGAFSASDSLMTIVNKVFNNIFGRDALPFEQTAWSGLTLGAGGLSSGELIWGIWSGYLGATNVPDTYKIPAQTRLLVTEAYTNALAANPTADAAASVLGSSAAITARNYLDGVIDVATAAPKVNGAAAAVNSLPSSLALASTTQAEKVASTAQVTENSIDTVLFESKTKINTIDLSDAIGSLDSKVIVGFSAGAGGDVIEINTDATKADTQVSGLHPIQETTINSGPHLFLTSDHDILELNFVSVDYDLGEVSDTLPNGADLVDMVGLIEMAQDGSDGFIIAYGQDAAYLFYADEDATDGDTVLSAEEIQLIGTFADVSVGAFDTSNFDLV